MCAGALTPHPLFCLRVYGTVMSDEVAERDSYLKRSKVDKSKHVTSNSSKRNVTASTTVEEKRFKSNESDVGRQSKRSHSPNDHYSTRNESVNSSKGDKKKTTYYSSSSANIKSTHNSSNDVSSKKSQSTSSTTSSKNNVKRKKSTSFYETIRECTALSKRHPLEDKLLISTSSSDSDNEKVDLNDELFEDILYEEKMIKFVKKKTPEEITQSDHKRKSRKDKKITSEIIPPSDRDPIVVISPPLPILSPPKPPSPPPPPPLLDSVSANEHTHSNTIGGVDECSDMDISEPSSHSPENDAASDNDDDQLYLQSLAKPVIMRTNETASGVMLPPPPPPLNMMPQFPQTFVHHPHHHPPPRFSQPQTFMSIPPQPINPYNHNYTYPSNVPMGNQPPQTHQFVSGGVPALRPIHHTSVPPGVREPPHTHINNLNNHNNLSNANYSVQYNNYGAAAPQPHINYAVAAGQRSNLPTKESHFLHTGNPIVTTSQYASKLQYSNHNTYGNGNAAVNPPPQNQSPCMINMQNPPQPMMNVQNSTTFMDTINANVPNNPQNPINFLNPTITAQSTQPYHPIERVQYAQQLQNVIPQEINIFELLPKTTQDYIHQTYTDSTAKSVATDTIYKDFHKKWSGISKIWGERSLSSFEIECQVGEGTYGKVYRTKDLYRDDIVALKKIRNNFDHEGFPITAVREIKILRQLCHPNIVKLRDVISDKSDVSDFLSSPGAFYLVFEYMEHDLLGVLESCKVTFSDVQIQSLFKQLMEALNYCHKRNFLHRDLKCSNILLNNKGVLKLADFGLARLYESEGRPYTNKVITLWYRPPELLFGQERYGPYVDIWSAGCILGELFTKRPILSGNKEIVQLDRIFKLCGSPTLKNWPEVIHLPLYQMMKPSVIYPRKLRNHFQFLPPDAIDLMDQMLQLDPHKRISSKEVLKSKFLIDIDPTKIDPPKFPDAVHFHELLYKQRSKMKNSHNQKHEPGSGKNDASDPNTSNSQFKVGSFDNQRFRN